MKFRLSKTILAVLVAGLAGSASAVPITKSATGTDLTDGASWGGTAPGAGDVATWSSTSLGPALTMATAQSWQGIDITGATGDIGISGAGILSLGSSGITLTGTRNFTIANTIDLTATQSWNVASGRTVSFGSLTDTGTVNLTLGGAGTYIATNTSANFNGGGTVTFGSGTTWQLNTASGQAGSNWFGSTGAAGTGSVITFEGGNAITMSTTSAIRHVNNNLVLKGSLSLGNASNQARVVNLYGAIDLNGGVRVINANHTSASTSTISGVISNGGLTKTGVGILSLRGTNTYTGVTTIKGDPGTTGAVNVLTINNGGIAGNLGAASSAAGNIVFGESGQSTGQLIYAGAGENTDRLFTIDGNAIIENNGSGALNFTGTGDLGKTSGILQTFAVGGTGDGSIAANIIKGAGAGSDVSVTKNGAGTWTLSGTNTYTAGTTVAAGTLKAGGTSAFGTGAATVSGGTLDLNGQILGNNITLSGGTLKGGSANYTGVISGTSGTFLAGTDAAVIYKINAAGATFSTLSGQGTFTQGLVTVTTALNPGNSPGIQTFAAGLTTTAGSTTTFEIAGTGTPGINYDQIALTGGTLTLNGSLAVTSYGGFNFTTLVAGDSFQLVKLSGGATFDTANSNYTFDFANATLANGLQWNTSEFANTGTISVVAAIPEPGTATLSLLGLSALLLRRRRKA